MNYIDTLNEICIILQIYSYMFFKQSFEKNHVMGVAYVVICLGGTIVNILNLLIYNFMVDA